MLGLPASLPAAEVIKRAKTQGMKLTTNYVYKIRSRGAAASGRPASTAREQTAAVRQTPRGRAATVRAIGTNGTHDEHFVTLVLDVGLARAAALLEKVRARVQDLSL